VFGLCVLLQAGENVASEIVRSDVSKDSDLPINAEIVNISGGEDTEGKEEVTESKSSKTLAKSKKNFLRAKWRSETSIRNHTTS
jgi:hypothetical protein